MLGIVVALLVLWGSLCFLLEPLIALGFALELYVLGPVLIREIVWHSVYAWAALRPSLPSRAVSPLPSDVAAVAFPGLGANWRQTLIPRGLFPNAAVLLPCHTSVCEAWENVSPAPGTLFYLPFRNNVAQRDDVMHALCHVRSVLNEDQHRRVILFGSSRGSAVALQVAARLTRKEVARVPLVICEGVFTTVEDVLDTRFSAPIRFLARAGLAWFTRYRPAENAEWSPLSAAQTFPHLDLPIVVVRSAADTVVVPALGERVVEALRTRGVKDVYDIKLSASEHSGYAWLNDADRNVYVRTLDSIYKAHV
jgi:pimeloyl-ACP methyl ester carboxylesterase